HVNHPSLLTAMHEQGVGRVIDKSPEPGFGCPHLLLGAFAFCHVYLGANVFNNISSFVENWMSCLMKVLHRAVRQHNPVILIKISFLAECLLEPFVKSAAIFGVHQSIELFSIGEVASLRI